MPERIDINSPQGTEDSPKAKPMTKKQAMLLAVGARMEAKFQEYSGAREEKEQEWVRSIRQHEGIWDSDERTKVEKAFDVPLDKAPPPVNITRPKTNIAISRMQDAQFPVGGDFNFYLEPTPVPSVIAEALAVEDVDPIMEAEAAALGASPEGMPTPKQVATDIIDQTAEAARLMSLEIQDDLVETGYGAKARLAIEDLAILGSAVIKGPVLSPHIRRIYEPAEDSDGQTVQILGVEAEPRIEVFRVDPRLFYPDPNARLAEELEDAFELHIMKPTDLQNLAETKGFMRSQIKEAFLRGPAHTPLPNSISDTAYLHANTMIKNRFMVKEYHGPLEKQLLFDGGVIDEEAFEDPLTAYFGEIWLCNGIVIRMAIDFIEGVHKVPYGIASWERDPSSVFGHGVPFLLRNSSRVVNNAYLLMLENAGLTSGPQIVLNKEMIEPAAPGGSYDIEPHKVWLMTEYGADVREAMQFVNVPSQMDGISQIIDMAMAFSDMESSTPQIQQGDMPSGTNTLTGFGKIMSATNIHQKRASMNWDDQITKGLIERHYHYRMQYGENPNAKGDAKVRIGGATERIDSEIRAQELERLIGLSQSSPNFEAQIDPAKAFRQLATLTRAGDILRTTDEVQAELDKQEAAGQQAPDAQAMLAQAALTKAEAARLEAETKQQQVALEGQISQGKMQLEQAKIQGSLQLQAQEVFARAQQASDERELEIIKMANDRELSVAELQAKLSIAAEDKDAKMQKIAADMRKFTEEIEVKHKFGEGI
jgi:hypothetical protein